MADFRMRRWSPARSPLGGGARALRAFRATALAVALGACSLVQEPAGDAPAPVGVGDPPIEAGPSTPAQVSAANVELERARRAFEARDYVAAAVAAQRVVDDYPTVIGSSEALWILAQASWATGDFERADGTSSRYADLVGPGDRRGAEAVLLGARAVAESGEPAQALRRLLETTPERISPVTTMADEFVRTQVRLVETDALGVLADGVASEHPLLPAVLVEYGIGLYYGGEVDAAGGVAQRVLASAASGESDRVVARSLLSGRIEETVGAALTLGLVLPSTGSPTMQEYASLVQEGVQVALQEAAERRRRPVTLSAMDDSGDPDLSRRAVQQLESNEVIAILGPLFDAQLAEAAQGRSGPTVLVSPTASMVPEGVDGVFSMAAPDPGAANALARHAVDRRYGRIALIHSTSPGSTEEASAFLEAYGALGTGAVQEFPYVAGATSFGEQLLGAVGFGAEVLVLPIPEDDIELLAPQVSHFGLDTLGIEVMGTAAWGEAETLDRVDARHTNGVVIASPRTEEGDGAYQRFVSAYERLHRKTLRSPIPAFGYDAAGLVLAAIDSGARSPADLLARMARIEEFEGATGVLSIMDGRIARTHALFEIRDGQLVPTGRRFE